MRSVPLVAPKRLELIEAPLPDGPRSGELLVKMRAVGLCGSDLHWWAEGRIHAGQARYPQVLGHEPVGEVVEVGAGVHGYKVGDRVSLEPSITCGHCEFCIAGRHNLCKSSKFMGGPEAQGCLRDFVVVPAHNADPIPDSLSWHEATLMEPVAVWVHTYELAPVRLGDTVAVMGAGSIGLLGIAMAKQAGAEMVLACDRVPHRLELAKAMGADIALNLNEDDFRDAVMQKTHGRGVDIVFDAAGDPRTINLGIQCARDGGRFVLIGIPVPMQFDVDLHTAMSKELNIQVMKRSNHKGRAAGALLAGGRIPTSLITHVLPLAQAQQGFEMLHEYSDGVGKLIYDFTL
ncbi:zinc-dependent alcohol dehydrogenase [Paludibaculum fermentans]|uniref:Alcohol dehydrogenase catalytic domain-containing protein n=1 Tax=Paludibaculum fermentans TaxID=1473598 RepID=A0A7S7NXQ2_PALFE|nr:alcohol dehydrogenase catalytic domain-containing protein [Paludibaculum fermentans]QOY91741.1 alcohol dehydrogenase catalytic domain-containing protein [Paludibaculum fermentans]